jgi:hypothetical protein
MKNLIYKFWYGLIFTLMLLSLAFGSATQVRAARLAEIGPAVTGVSSTVSDGAYTLGMSIPITVTFDVAVNVTGTPQLTLETGTTNRVINYAAGSGTNTLTFSYGVQIGDYNLDLDYTNRLALSLNGGTIVDASTADPADIVLPVPGTPGSLSANKNIVIEDGNTPTVTNVTSSVVNGTYVLGALIPVAVTFSEAVKVTGTPQLTLETGATDQVVDYSSGNGTNTLIFNYTVQTGDVNPDLDYFDANAFSLNGGTIQDGVANNAILALPAPGASGSLSANKNIVIAWDAANVMNVASTDGFYALGVLIPIEIAFSEAVNVTGTPQLTLETGNTDRVASYSSGSGTAILTFNYTVQAGDEATDLDYVSTSALTLNGGSIQNLSATNVALTLPTPSAAGSLSANNNVLVDAVAPDTSIDTYPDSSSTSNDATFTFAGIDNIWDEAALDFQCKLDDGSFQTCLTPTNYTGLANGSHTFSVRARDPLTNTDATPASYTWIAGPFTVTINQAVGQSDPATTSPIHFTATFSEPVSGFTAADISFAGTTLSGTLSATVTEIAPMDGTTYDVAVTGMIPKGTVFVSIPAGAATSIPRGLSSPVATSTDNNVIFDYVLAEFASTGSNDGWLLESSETSNQGGSNNSALALIRLGDNSSNQQYRGLLDFDTASLPNNAVLFAVNLRIVEQGMMGTNPFTTHGDLIGEIRSGFFGQFAALQNDDFQAVADKAACKFGSAVTMAIGTAYRCVFYTAAYPHINKAGRTQLRLRFQIDDNNNAIADVFNFYSSNCGCIRQRPRLFIKYYIPPVP